MQNQILYIDASQLNKAISQDAADHKDALINQLRNSTIIDLDNHYNKLLMINKRMSEVPGSIEQLKDQIKKYDEYKQYVDSIESIRLPIQNKVDVLNYYEAELPDDKTKLLNSLKDDIET